MCWNCVLEKGGDKVHLNDDMKKVCNLIWTWYNDTDEINGVGGDLHVQLDDHNLEDHFLEDDWNKYITYSQEIFLLGQKIVERLRELTLAERQAIVFYADPYSSSLPFPDQIKG